MHVCPVSNISYGTKVFQTPVSVEKPVPVEQPKADVLHDVFEKGHDVAFNGTLGGVLGVVSGEIVALKTIEMANVTNLFWPLAGFFGCCAGLGFLGSFVEDSVSRAQTLGNIIGKRIFLFTKKLFFL